MPQNVMTVYTDGNPLELVEIDVTLTNATFVVDNAAQFIFNFDEEPKETPIYGYELMPTTMRLVGLVNGGSFMLMLTSDDDTVNGTVTVSRALTQVLKVEVGKGPVFELQPGSTSGQFSLAIAGDPAGGPDRHQPRPEIAELRRRAAGGRVAASEARAADSNLDVLTVTTTADALQGDLWAITLDNGVFVYDHTLVTPTGALLGAGLPLILVFPDIKFFAVSGAVLGFEFLLDVESADSELRGELKVPEGGLQAPFTLSTLLAGGSFTFPTGSTGGPFSLAFGGGSLATRTLRRRRRAARLSPPID